VKRPQFVLAGLGVVLLFLIYFFGQTIPPKRLKVAPRNDSAVAVNRTFGIDDVLNAAKSKLTPFQLSYVNALEHSVIRGDVKKQREDEYSRLAAFWRDSVREGYVPYTYYMGELAKLENSEKRLTFAAQLFLDNLRGQDDAGLRAWMAGNAKTLFERSLQMDPDNDSLKVGLGASYIFGSSAGSPQEVMSGIQRILEVANRDSTNMYAQFMLGLGGEISGQFDKAIARLTTVVRHEPGNTEAILTLADANERVGNRKEAIRWYQKAKELISDPKMINEIDQHMQSIQ